RGTSGSRRIADEIRTHGVRPAEIRNSASRINIGRRIEHHVNRFAGIGSVDAGNLPTAEKCVDRCGPGVTDAPSTTEWQVVNGARDVDQLHIVAGWSPFRGQIADILRIRYSNAGMGLELLF